MELKLHFMLLFGIFVTTCHAHGTHRQSRLRTVVTTDMEQDDLASWIRYLLYTNELETQGLIYTSSRYHWAGDGNGTEFFLPDREYDTPQTSWRWTGTRTIQDQVLKAYGEVYQNLRVHDPAYPTPKELLSTVKIGNIDFEGEFARDTEGSDLIRSLLFDKDPRTLYLQAWGGTSTIARALKSIEECYSNSSEWRHIKAAVSEKAVILASGFQDQTYVEYIAPNWPHLRVENFQAGYITWGYNCNAGFGNTRGLPDDSLYFSGEWTKANIQVGPYGKLYRSWLDGQAMPGDPLDVFGDPTKESSFCKPLQPYDFLSEGDNVAFNPLLKTGIESPANPSLGGWGGRSKQNSTTPDLWVLVDKEKSINGTSIGNYTTDRWMEPVQNDFAARMAWTLSPDYANGNHPPSVKILNAKKVHIHPGASVTLGSVARDPDRDEVKLSWWQFFEEGTYSGAVALSAANSTHVTVTVPSDAKPGETISLILQGKDNGKHPLTRYDRVLLKVV